MAAETIYLYVEGSKQGAFRGDREDGAIVCLDYRYKLELPFDPRTGLMMLGKRQHNAVTVRKPLNATSPQFAQALVTNEVLKSVTLRFAREGEVYYAIGLSNARVMVIQHAVPEQGAAPVEDLSFMFQHIEWGSKEAGIVVGDDWSA